MKLLERVSGGLAIPIAAAVLLTCPSAVSGQSPAPILVSGTVVDGSVGAPVGGALVTVIPGGRQTLSDSAGAFRLEGLTPGEYDLTVRAFGYRTLEERVAVTSGRPPLTLVLVPDPLALEGVGGARDLRVTLGGYVRDARTDEPIPYASLWITPDAVREVARGGSGADGSFSIEGVRVGRYLLGTRMAGYVPQLTPVAALANGEPVEVRLEPDSLVQAGLPVLAKELRGRRNAFPGIARAFTPAEINRFDRTRALDFVTRDTQLAYVPCEGLGMCVINRGRPVQPLLIIDDRQVCGGSALDVLAARRPTEFQTIEVFMGPMVIVRAYTHEYAEKEARRQALDPGVLPPTIGCLGDGGLEAPRRPIPRLSDTLAARAPRRR